MKNNINIIFVVSLALILGLGVSACGGGGSSGSSSETSTGFNGGNSGNNGSTPSNPQPILETQVSLVDPINYPVGSQVTVWHMNPMTVASQTLADTSPGEMVMACSGTLDPTDPAAMPCTLENGDLWIPCVTPDHFFKVTYDGDEVSSFEIQCTQSNLVQQIPNRNFIMIVSVDSRTDEIVQHNFDLDTLNLTVINRFPTGRSPQKLVHHATKNMLYVLNQADNNIALFHISGLNESVEEVLPRVATGNYPMDILTNPQGTCLFVNSVGTNSSAVTPYAIDSKGSLSALPRVNFNSWAPPTAMTLSDDGIHFYVSTINEGLVRHYTLNPTTCALTLSDSVNVNFLVSSMLVNDSHNFLYLTDATSNTFHSINLTNGMLLSETLATLAPNTNESIVPCTGLGCESSNPSDWGQILLVDNDVMGDHTSVINGGAELKAFHIDETGSYAYATRKDGSSVDVYLVDNDCTLTPYFSTVQGGDSLGIIVNMIPLDQQDCTQALFIPETQTRIDNTGWLGNFEP